MFWINGNWLDVYSINSSPLDWWKSQHISFRCRSICRNRILKELTVESVEWDSDSIGVEQWCGSPSNSIVWEQGALLADGSIGHGCSREAGSLLSRRISTNTNIGGWDDGITCWSDRGRSGATTYFMPTSACICWVRFKNTLVGTRRWSAGTHEDEGLGSLNECQYYSSFCNEVYVSVGERWVLPSLSESIMGWRWCLTRMFMDKVGLRTLLRYRALLLASKY